MYLGHDGSVLGVEITIIVKSPQSGFVNFYHSPNPTSEDPTRSTIFIS